MIHLGKFWTVVNDGRYITAINNETRDSAAEPVNIIAADNYGSIECVKGFTGNPLDPSFWELDELLDAAIGERGIRECAEVPPYVVVHKCGARSMKPGHIRKLIARHAGATTGRQKSKSA